MIASPRCLGHVMGIPSILFVMVCSFLLILLPMCHHMSNINEKLDALSESRVELEATFNQFKEQSSARRKMASSAKVEHISHRNTTKTEDAIVIYNRVPKTGSTTFVSILNTLCYNNSFHTMNLYISERSWTLSTLDQLRFITNITTWNEMTPAIIHSHVAFIDFSRFGISKRPIYINMIRNPLERLISYYYFLQNGDNLGQNKYRQMALKGRNETFDDCVARGGGNCDLDMMWVQIPFFCGHHPECWELGNQWALEEAKHNVVNHYLVVGVTELMRTFLAILEATLPSFFRGATALYDSNENSVLRQTVNKIPPTQATIEKIKTSKIWMMENEFYEFVYWHFRDIQRSIFRGNLKNLGEEREQQFHYEKFRPKLRPNNNVRLHKYLLNLKQN